MPLGQGYGTSGIRQGGLGVTGTYGSGFTSGAQGRGITGYGSTGTTGMNAIPSNYLQQAAYGKSMKDQAAQYNQRIIQQQAYYDQTLLNQNKEYDDMMKLLLSQNQTPTEQYIGPTGQPMPGPSGGLLGKWYQRPDGTVYWNEKNRISTKDILLGEGYAYEGAGGHYDAPGALAPPQTYTQPTPYGGQIGDAQSFPFGHYGEPGSLVSLGSSFQGLYGAARPNPDYSD